MKMLKSHKQNNRGLRSNTFLTEDNYITGAVSIFKQRVTIMLEIGVTTH